MFYLPKPATSEPLLPTQARKDLQDCQQDQQATIQEVQEL